MSKMEREPAFNPKTRWFGMPVAWDWRHWSKSVWNPQDCRLFPPRRMGIGWSLNFHQLLKRMRIVH